jgi:serine protease AprX
MPCICNYTKFKKVKERKGVRMNKKKLRKLLQCIFVIALLLIFSSFSWAQKENLNLPEPPVSRAGNRAVLADLDGDGISDGLQAKLKEAPSNELFDVVVTFSGAGNAESAKRAVGPFRVKRKFGLIPGFSAAMTAAQAKGLARTPGVFRVEEEFMVYANLDAANRDFGTKSARVAYGLTGEGIGICVVDTGVDPSHEQLDNGKVAGFLDFTVNPVVEGVEYAYDNHYPGHGTHVSSIAAGAGKNGIDSDLKGVAPGALIYAAKVLDASGSGSDPQVISGVEWCTEQAGVKIISLSLGSQVASDGNDALSLTVDAAVDQGFVVVAAAGNYGADPDTISSPGSARSAITVGAAAEWSAPTAEANFSEGMFLAWFSSRGPTIDGRIKPDVIAPGMSIKSAEANTTNGYIPMSGTSMATPFVSGTVALALQSDPSLTPTDVKELLKSTAKDCGPNGWDNDWGAGLLDGYKFVAEAVNPNLIKSNAFPTLQPILGSVGNGSSVWTHNILISEEDINTPIAVTIIVEGEPYCPLPGWCPWLSSYEWSPDLDAQLIDPNGDIIAESACPLTDPFNPQCGNIGRQETLHAMPTYVGAYTVKVFPWDGGKGGNFTLDCSSGPVASAKENICDDAIDDDRDGQTDCDDTDCASDPVCGATEPEICGDGKDNDGDGATDCADSDCAADPVCLPEGDCNDNIDNDGDGATDCADSDCSGDSACATLDSEICTGGVDEDLDGLIDCDDPDCKAECAALYCFKGRLDGDCNPKKDGNLCPDCLDTTPPGSEICTGGVDEDLDGLIDCDDPDCLGDPACSSCLPKGDLCTDDQVCCSGKCRGGKCR